MPPPGFETGTFHSLGRRADHYTMRSRWFHILNECYLLLYPNATLKLIQNCIHSKRRDNALPVYIATMVRFLQAKLKQIFKTLPKLERVNTMDMSFY